LISSKGIAVRRPSDSVFSYREKLTSFILTGVLAAIAIPLLLTAYAPYVALGVTLLAFAGIAVGRLSFPNNRSQLRFTLTQSANPQSIGREAGPRLMEPYTFGMDLFGGYHNLALTNEAFTQSLTRFGSSVATGEINVGSPSGFTMAPGNDDQGRLIQYLYDMMVFLILHWIAAGSVALRQEHPTAFVAKRKADLPESLLDSNLILQAEKAREAQPDYVQSHQVERQYLLPRGHTLIFEIHPFPTIRMRGKFVELDVECRLTKSGVRNGSIFGDYMLEIKATPRWTSFLVLVWPWELALVDHMIDSFPAYFGLDGS